MFLLAVLVISLLLPGPVLADPYYVADDLFTSRDMRQEAKMSKAVALELADGQDVRIDTAGVYVLSGTVSGVTVYVEAGEDDKVQLVLDGVSITNADFPCVYVRTADKVFITTSADSSLSVTGAFRPDGSTNTDAVIFSRTDLVLNGTASLTVSSPDIGIAGRDDLKVTGGTYIVTAATKCFEAHDSIRIAGGVFILSAGTDGFHVESKKDNGKEYICIFGGDITVNAMDDAFHATSVIQIDGGSMNITAAEGLEATVIQVNGGAINISATDDGINAACKSASLSPLVEINGGSVTIVMSAGDTDAIDSNGDIVISGGTVTLSARSTFDYKDTGVNMGGTIVIGGEEYTGSILPNQFMGEGPGGER